MLQQQWNWQSEHKLIEDTVKLADMSDKVEENQRNGSISKVGERLWQKTHMGQIPQDGDFGQNVAFFF